MMLPLSNRCVILEEKSRKAQAHISPINSQQVANSGLKCLMLGLKTSNHILKGYIMTHTITNSNAKLNLLVAMTKQEVIDYGFDMRVISDEEPKGVSTYTMNGGSACKYMQADNFKFELIEYSYPKQWRVIDLSIVKPIPTPKSTPIAQAIGMVAIASAGAICFLAAMIFIAVIA